MKSLVSAVALAAAALCASAPAQAGIVISFTPASSTIDIGQTVTVDMSISGLDAEILSGFDFNVVWNSARVTGSAFTVMPACSQMGVAAMCDPDAVLPQGNFGATGFAVEDDDTLAGSQADSFLLAQITFTGLSGGLTNITLGNDLDFERNFVGRLFGTLDVTVGSAEICVRSDLGSTLPGQCAGTPPGIPEPSSYALAGVALLAAGWARRGRRRETAAA